MKNFKLFLLIYIKPLYREEDGKIREITLVVKFKKGMKRVTATSMAEARMMILTEYKRRYDRKMEIKEAIKTFKEGLVKMWLRIFNNKKRRYSHYLLPKVLNYQRSSVDIEINSCGRSNTKSMESLDRIETNFHLKSTLLPKAVSKVKIINRMFGLRKSGGSVSESN